MSGRHSDDGDASVRSTSQASQGSSTSRYGDGSYTTRSNATQASNYSQESGATTPTSNRGQNRRQKRGPYVPKPKGFKEEIRKLYKTDSLAMMNLAEQNLGKARFELIMWCSCFLWVPALFVLVGLNVQSSCERPLQAVMIAYGAIIYCIVPLGIFSTTIASWRQDETCFQASQCMQSLNVLIGMGVSAWAMSEAAGTTSENCYNPLDLQIPIPINPRDLLLIFAAIVFGLLTCICSSMVCVLVCVLAKIRPEEEDMLYMATET